MTIFHQASPSFFKKIPRIDYHVHTDLVHGKSSVEQCIQSAVKSRLIAVAFTEHTRKTSDFQKKYFDTIDRMENKYDIRIYRGAECRIYNLDGDIDIDETQIDKYDLILGVIHKLPSTGSFVFRNHNDVEPNDAAEIETEATCNAAKQGIANVIGHPTRSFSDHYGLSFPPQCLHRMIQTAKDAGVAFELNAKTRFLPEIIAACIHYRAIISIGSDAHDAEEVGTASEIIEKAAVFE